MNETFSTNSFYGRQAELAAWDKVLQSPKAQAVMVTGQQGMGKSLLLRAMIAAAHKRQDLVCATALVAVITQETVANTLERIVTAAQNAVRNASPGAENMWQGFAEIPTLRNVALDIDASGYVLEVFIQFLQSIATALPDNGRVVIGIDPRRDLAPHSDEPWLEVITRLPNKIKLLFAQRLGDVLVHSSLFSPLRSSQQILLIPEDGLGALDEEAVAAMVHDAAKATGLSIKVLDAAVSRYQRHPYAVSAALNLISSGEDPGDLPSDPTPHAIASEQWRRVCQGGKQGVNGEAAIRLFEAYAILEEPSPDSLVEATAGLRPTEHKSVIADEYIGTLLHSEIGWDDETSYKVIYHNLLAEHIASRVSQVESRSYHERAATFLREGMNNPIGGGTVGSTFNDILGMLRLPRHALAAWGPEEMANTIVYNCTQHLIYWGDYAGVFKLTNEALALVPPDSEARSKLLINKAIQLRNKTLVGAAETHLLEALENERQNNRPQEKLRACYELLVMYLRLGEPDETIAQIHAHILDTKHGQANPTKLSNAYGHIADIYFNYEDYRRAADVYKIALGLEQRVGREEGVVFTAERLANLYRTLGDQSSEREMNRLLAHRGAKQVEGVAAPMNIDAVKGQIDFGIISIREDEFKAVLDRFQPDAYAEGHRRYEIGNLQTAAGGYYSFASLRLSEQGQGEAQNATRDLIEDLAPRWLLLIGICGSIPSADFCLGDVVCATRVHDFSVRAVKEGGREQSNVGGGPMHPEVRSLLGSLPAIERQLLGWNSEEAIGMVKPLVPVPGQRSKRYYGDSKWKADVRQALLRHFPVGQLPRPPLVSARSIAASDALVKSTVLLSQWQEAARSVSAVEMELGGVYLAARRIDREIPILAVRGISDIVGFKRDEVWTKYACETSAAFAYALLKFGIPFQSRPAPIDAIK